MQCYYFVTQSSKMVRAEEIRDGLFSISWNVKNLSTSKPSTQELVHNLRKGVLTSCSLSCSLKNSVMILKLKTANPPNSLRGFVVTASFGGVKQKMTLSESFWEASWGKPVEICRNGPEKSYVVSFEILIDFTPHLVTTAKGSMRVLNHLKKLWENKTGFDVTFKCGDEDIKAHTLILTSGSPVLAAMFQNNFIENRERIVLINDIEVKVFENLLRYIYVGECALLENAKPDESKIADLLVAADKYAIDSLTEECETHLSQTLSVENAAKYLVLAHLHNCPKLRQSALNFMGKNAKAVCSREDWLEMMKSYPELCFQATKLMVGI